MYKDSLINEKLKKQRDRLNRRAIKARETRFRKRQYIESLEDKKSRLQAKLAQLETCTDTKSHVEEVHRSEQTEVKKKLFDLLNDRTTNVKQDIIRNYIQEFIVNSRRRQNTAECHISKVGECLVPDLQSKFVMWALNHENSGIFDDPNSIFLRVMTDVVGLSSNQMTTLRSFRGRIRQEAKKLSNCQQNLIKLRDEVRQVLSERHKHIDEVFKLLTPIQVANFCHWVDSNPICMQMLNVVWDPVGLTNDD